MDLFNYLLTIVYFKVLFMHSDSIGGFTEDQAMIFAATVIFSDAFIMTFLSDNLWWFPVYINRGDLDYYLARPVSPFFFLGLKEISVSSMSNLFLSLAFLIYQISSQIEFLTATGIVLFFIFFLNGVHLYFMMRLTMIIPVFWSPGGRGLDEVFWNMQLIGKRPDGIFKGVFRHFIVNFIPLAFISSYPVRILYGGFSNWEEILHVVVVTSLFTTFFFFLWRKALSSYSSASS
jgi:ABC-2 type transport system permease protein